MNSSSLSLGSEGSYCPKHEDPYCLFPKVPFRFEDGKVFDEEFVVDNLACTCKIKTIVEDEEKKNNGKALSYCLSKNTAKKEVYLVHFHGTWKELEWTLKTICVAGLTFNRNANFYKHNKTRVLLMDLDGKKGDDYGMECLPAESVIEEGNKPGVLVIPSARCNYVKGTLDSTKIKKYHVFAYSEPYDCTDAKTVEKLFDYFIMTIDNREEEEAKELFPWDKEATGKWQRFFSKSVFTAEEIEKIPTINVRYNNGANAIFEYRNFEQIFKKDFLTVTKCTDNVPKAKDKAYKYVKPYCVPPFGGFSEHVEKPKKKKDTTVYRDFWKELKDFAGLTKGVYRMPHYDVGRLNEIKTSNRNIVATKAMWGIVFNIYAAERFSGKTMDNREDFALAWFHSIFNKSNVEEYKEFMNDFKPEAEYNRKCEDTSSLERHYEYPESIENESKFHITVKIGFGESFNIDGCSTRDELERAANEAGMSESTKRRKAKKLGLGRKTHKQHKQHKSKLDKYVGLSEAELDELVKKGELNRMAKHRIIERRKKQ